jgi:poly-gamma-glutamate biosynthesis protein PgsC/CapC
MDMNLLAFSIGIGLVVSLLFSEVFGLAAGGLVVPGYIALYLTRPIEVGATLAAALLTFFLVRIASTFVIIYGRRRTVVMILVGYAVGVLISSALGVAFETMSESLTPGAAAPPGALGVLVGGRDAGEFAVIGYIVPGLIAIWLDRQGVVPTLAALITSAIVVRLILVLAVPEELQWFEARSEPFAVEELVER